jgi:hypothetical protein
VAYFSAKHSPQECNYDIYDKELLAIIKALEEWQPELEGSQSQFEIITDHKNLATFATSKQLNARQARWAEFLSQFDFRIVYRPGTLNSRADALSRRPQDTPQDTTDDRVYSRFKALIDPSKFSTDFLLTVSLYTLDLSQHIDDLITVSYAKSPIIQTMLDCLTNARQWPQALRSQLRLSFAECQVIGGRIYHRGRLVVPPDDPDIQFQIVYRTHTSSPAGHPGRDKTLDLVSRYYWWPGVSHTVGEFISGCLPCDKSKVKRNLPQGLLKPINVPFEPWQDISVDYITPLPVCARQGSQF